MGKRLEYFEGETGYVYVDDDESKKIHLENHFSDKFVDACIKRGSQFTFLLLMNIGGKAFAAPNMCTMKDIRQREVQQSLADLEQFYTRIGDTVKDALKNQPPSVGSGTIIQLPPSVKTGPQLIPFHELARVKTDKLIRQETNTLTQAVIRNNELLQKINNSIKAGFTVGTIVTGAKGAHKLWQWGASMIKDQQSKKKNEELTKLQQFIETLVKAGPVVGILVAVTKIYPKIGEKFPEAIRENIFMMPPKKHWFVRLLKSTVDFKSPTPYVILGVAGVGTMVYVFKYQPESTMSSVVSKLVDATNKNLHSFTSLARNLLEDNLKMFKQTQQTNDQNKNEIIKELKNKTQILEKDNMVIREKYHKLELHEAKTSHLLDECTRQNENYESLIGQQKTYYQQKEILNSQKLLDQPLGGKITGDIQDPKL